jgi:hypothetical protein
MTANTEWTLSKERILEKTVKPATAWREATATKTIGAAQRQQQKGDPQQQLKHERQQLIFFAEIRQKVVRTAKNS